QARPEAGPKRVRLSSSVAAIAMRCRYRSCLGATMLGLLPACSIWRARQGRESQPKTALQFPRRERARVAGRFAPAILKILQTETGEAKGKSRSGRGERFESNRRI